MSAPIVLLAIVQILPTFDDWTTLSSPNYDKEYLKYFLPFGTVWRPGDALLGFINAINYKGFPILNHILIYMAHLASTFIVYRITKVHTFECGEGGHHNGRLGNNSLRKLLFGCVP